MPARFLVIEIRKRNSKQCFQRRGSQGVITCRRGHGVKSVEVMEKEDFTVKEDFTRYVLSSDHASFYSVFLHLIMQTLAAYLEHVRCLLPLASLRFVGFSGSLNRSDSIRYSKFFVAPAPRMPVISSPEISSPEERSTARWMMLSSSRTFPGHRYCISCASAPEESLLRTRPRLSLHFWRKKSARRGMSSLRSRSGGMGTGTT